MNKGVSSAIAFFIIILVSIVAGFFILQKDDSISDTAEYGTDALRSFNALQEELGAPSE